MSKFNNYARELNTIATEAFKSYTEAEQRLKAATDAMSKYNRFGGNIPQGLAAEHARAKADYLEAKDAYTAAKKGLSASDNEQVKTLRKNLMAAIEAENMADPAQLDTATLELLKSGILSANEYAHLMSEAKKSSNNTMVRLIGKYAGEAAERATDPMQAASLRGITYDSKSAGYADRVQAFDNMLDVMNRAANNPAMVSCWEELTADIVEKF